MWRWIGRSNGRLDLNMGMEGVGEIDVSILVWILLKALGNIL